MVESNGSGPQQSPGKRPGGPSVKMSRNLVSWLVLLGLAMLLVALLNHSMGPNPEISISKFKEWVRDDQVQLVRIKEDGLIEGLRKEPEAPNLPLQFRVAYPREAIDHDFLNEMVEAVRKGGGDVKYEKQNQFVLLLLSMLPWILIFGFIWFFIFRQLRSSNGPGGMLGNFGRSRHRVTPKEHTNVTFADVAGIEEAKDEVQEIIEFLKSPKKFQRLGGRIPRGILLVGAPGCGKTLLAKAIAGEADVPFFSISGSDFVEMFVGVGASRVRDLFRQAKENSPCIIFLDEIDAVGREGGQQREVVRSP